MDFWAWWQHLPHTIDPTLIDIGPVRVYWYGIMYVVAFGVIYILMRYRHKREEVTIDSEQLITLLYYALIGVLVGGRLGYVLFYNLDFFIQNPLAIVLPVTGPEGNRSLGLQGMSYHGGLVGVVAMTWVYARKHKKSVLDLAEQMLPAIPLGYAFGRLGNFLNGELWGRVTEQQWGMSFPGAPGDALRHPSQLYEMVLEGVVLFALLWWLRNKTLPRGVLFSIYLFGYAIARSLVELVREPDPQLGFIVGPLTMGQLLSIGMVVGAAILLLVQWKKRDAQSV